MNSDWISLRSIHADYAHVKIRDLDLDEKGKFYYLFDFGDDWWHELSVLKIEDASGSKGYPKITKKVGDSPGQYPDYEDDDDDF